MALSPAYSAGYKAALVDTPPTVVHSSNWGAKLRFSKDKLTFTAAGQGTAPIIHMPAGKIVIFPDLCRLVCPQGTATADLHVGYGPYTNAAGSVVNRDDNAFADNVDIGGAAKDEAFSLPAAPYLEFESQSGFDIEVMIDTANSPASGDLIIVVAFAQGN